MSFISSKNLGDLTKKRLSPTAARFAKQIALCPRYYAQLREARKGYRRYGADYPQNVLFVAGLPKSGTSWLKKMLLSNPGFVEVLHPGAGFHEQALGGSHDYDMPEDLFELYDEALVVTRMHVHGSRQNIEALRRGGVKYVVLVRDLRDVAISHYHYVRQTPWHPEHVLYENLDLRDGLTKFAERTLLGFAAWMRSWRDNGDPEMALTISYERMLEDGPGVMTEVARHFGLDDRPETIHRIIEENSFKKMSGGRRPGEENNKAFARKGVAGDWVNHFTPEIADLYKHLIGEFLIEFGYEKDLDW